MNNIENHSSTAWRSSAVMVAILVYLVAAPVCFHKSLAHHEIDEVLMTGLSGPFQKPSRAEREMAVSYIKSKLTPQVGAADAALVAQEFIKWSEFYKLSPRFILGVMHIESRFDIWALSPKGAAGLLQIMPATGEWLTNRLGLDWLGDMSLFEPKLNVRLGIAYLAYLRDRYGNDMRAVLSAYNAGPGAFEKGRAKGKGYQMGYYSKIRTFLVSDLR